MAERVTPDYLSKPLDFAAGLIEWSPHSSISKMVVERGTLDPSLSIDEQAELILEQRNRLEKAKSRAQ